MKKTVIVTGGSRGIGKSIAMELALLGYDIAIFYEKNTEAAQQTARDIEVHSKAACFIFQVSVTDVGGVQDCIRDMEIQGRKIYGLINNAGIVRDGFLMTMKESDWLDVINTNIFGTFNCTKAVLPALKRNGEGIIVNLASVSGLKGETGQLNYSATKSAIISFTRSLAVELAGYPVNVYAIAPGFIRTEMVKTMPERILERHIENIPLHRLGETEDVASVIRYIFKENPAYMLGQVFVPDGGLSCI